MSVMRILRAGLLAAGAVGLLAGGTHITPTVVLAKKADVIRSAVPDATQFFVRTVEIGQADFQRIKEVGSFEPDKDRVPFYYGRDAAGRVDGVVLFPQVNNQHGPLEVGLAMNPDGTVRKVVVTKATVETKPWVLRALRSGLTRRFEGMRPDDDPAAALAGMADADLGRMPRYMASVVAEAVARGLVLYGVLYSE